MTMADLHYCVRLFGAIIIDLVLVFRWQLVVHGGVDGCSRIPVYLKCSDNNRARTVFQVFIEGVGCMVFLHELDVTRVEKMWMCLCLG